MPCVVMGMSHHNSTLLPCCRSQVSLVALVMIGRLWKENYGDRSFSALHHTKEASRKYHSQKTRDMLNGGSVGTCNPRLLPSYFEVFCVSWYVFCVPSRILNPSLQFAALRCTVALPFISSRRDTWVCSQDFRPSLLQEVFATWRVFTTRTSFA